MSLRACLATLVVVSTTAAAGARAMGTSQPVAIQAATETTSVLVSRREVRVSFSIDSLQGWGWPDRKERSHQPRYLWVVAIDGMDGRQMLRVALGGDEQSARTFPSLDRLLDSSRVELCQPGMFWQCTDLDSRATAERGRVVLLLRDSARIARLFGMRPMLVQAWARTPRDTNNRQESVRVQYVEPQVPQPDSATRADAARSWRRHLASITRISRTIEGADSHGSLWLEVGQSVRLYVAELHCVHDACGIDRKQLSDSGWTFSDSRIARVRRAAPPPKGSIVVYGNHPGSTQVEALRPGRTMIIVRGVHGRSDSLPSDPPPNSRVERLLVVTPPLARVDVVSHPDTVRVREPFTLRVLARDVAGQRVSGVPVRLEPVGSDTRYLGLVGEPIQMQLTQRGRAHVVARVGRLADTVTITVVDSAAHRRRP